MSRQYLIGDKVKMEVDIATNIGEDIQDFVILDKTRNPLLWAYTGIPYWLEKIVEILLSW